MPDKYGFETREDRAEQRRNDHQPETAAGNRRFELHQRHDATVRDILDHYLRAYELEDRYDVATFTDPPAWGIGPRGALRDEARVRIQVEVGFGQGVQDVLTISDTSSIGTPDEAAIDRLGAVLHEHTTLPVLLLDPTQTEGLPPRRVWATGDAAADADFEVYR